MQKFKKRKLIIINLNNIICAINSEYNELLSHLTLNSREHDVLFLHCTINKLLQSIISTERHFDKVFIISTTDLAEQDNFHAIIEFINCNFTFKIYTTDCYLENLQNTDPILNDIQNFVINSNKVSGHKLKKRLSSKGLKSIFSKIENDPNLRFFLSKV